VGEVGDHPWPVTGRIFNPTSFTLCVFQHKHSNRIFCELSMAFYGILSVLAFYGILSVLAFYGILSVLAFWHSVLAFYGILSVLAFSIIYIDLGYSVVWKPWTFVWTFVWKPWTFYDLNHSYTVNLLGFSSV